MYLLDTNVVSELRLRKRADLNVLKWSDAIDDELCFVSVMTIMELQYGALLLDARDKVAGKVFREWIVEKVLPDFEDRILPATTEIALACAAMHVPNPKGERDAWIAATAFTHNLTVVTRNTRHFEGAGARLLNPWVAV